MHTNLTDTEFLERMRLYETDHAPTGWPAIQMQDVTRLCDMVDYLRASLKTSEPFGYFRPTLDGWIDCAETDEGARPLYEAAYAMRLMGKTK